MFLKLIMTLPPLRFDGWSRLPVSCLRMEAAKHPLRT
jgi:hypothetical protein